MTVAANKEIMRQFIAASNAGDLAALAEFWAPDIVHHTRLGDHYLDGIKFSYALMLNAFPDLTFTVEDMIAEDDKVVTRLTTTGTHRGDFMGVSPTGKRVSWASVDISRFAHGKIVEHWGVFDELHLMEQLALVPPQYLASMS